MNSSKQLENGKAIKKCQKILKILIFNNHVVEILQKVRKIIENSIQIL